MKKIIQILLIVHIAFFVWSYGEGLTVDFPSEQIFINDQALDNNHQQYPVFIYNDILYLPLEYSLTQNLGLKVGWFDKKSISLYSGIPQKNQRINDVNNYTHTSIAPKAVDYDIYINQSRIKKDSDYPYMAYKNMIYMPLNEYNLQSVFNCQLIKNDDESIQILSLDHSDRVKNYNRVADAYFSNSSQYKYIDQIQKKYETLKKIMIPLSNDEEYTSYYDYSKSIIYSDKQGRSYNLVIFDNNDMFIGEYIDNQLNNTGVYYWNDGSKYVGEIKNGMFHGVGRIDYGDNYGRSPIEYYNNGLVNKSQTKYTKKIYKPTRKEKILVVRTEFKDIKFKYSDSAVYDLLYGKNSVNKYYNQESQGKINFVPVKETYGDINDGIISVTLDENHPRLKQERSRKNQEILLKSLDKINDFNFEKYDDNGDGHIQPSELHIINMVAGYEYTKNLIHDYSVYAHQGYLIGSSREKQNVDLVKYVQIGELVYKDGQSNLIKRGIVAHEIGHLLGMFDMYDTDYSSEGLGIFSIMSSGGTLYVGNKELGKDPISFDPYSLYKMGFINYQTVDQQALYKLYSKAYDDYNILKVPTNNPEKYYLVENRQFIKNDLDLENFSDTSGILVYYINETVINAKEPSNTVNNDEFNKGIDLVESSDKKYLDDSIDYPNYDVYYNSDTRNVLDFEGPYLMKVIQSGNVSTIKIEKKE